MKEGAQMYTRFRCSTMEICQSTDNCQ